MEAIGRRSAGFQPRNDADYYESRAEAELHRARNAEHPEAARAHYLIAGVYLDRAHGGTAPDVLEVTPADQVPEEPKEERR
ncbi:MAG TPA: hypothetical protein VFT56_00580 [Sphingomonas sp.]|nr:hypothetical protein [Sphingomonas sp.]